MTKPKIYLDNASATPVDPEVLKAMLPYFSEEYGNPNSLHLKGKNAKIALDNARETVAEILNCRPDEIIFTGNGTEANNLAIFGAARANQNKGKHLITTEIEHTSILAPFNQLKKEGFEITYLKVDNLGMVDIKRISQKVIQKNTTLVSVMYANNEIGTIEPIKEIGEICRNKGVIFHTDACQAAGYLTLNVEELNVDLMSINASKIYGPKGVGALYIRKSTKLEPIIYGGGQENNLRSGTHNIPGIIGLAKALQLIRNKQKTENARLIKLRDRFIKEILNTIPNSRLNGPLSNRLPNNINFSIKQVDSQNLLLLLDEAKIYVSTGAACGQRNTKPSHVLQAIGLSQNMIDSTIRVTLGKYTTKQNLDYMLKILRKIINTTQP